MGYTESSLRIFAGSTGKAFAMRMCDYLDIKLGDSETIHFSDGNIFVKINESIRSNDVFIVQPIGEDPNNEFVELLFWIDAFKRASAAAVTAIVPFFSYSKGDKKDEPRVSIRARVCAESIELAGADRVITMELHSPQVQGFFKKPVDHLFSTEILAEYVSRKELITPGMVVVSPDSGYAKRARVFADILHCDVAIGEKIRSGHDENAKVLNVIGDVKGRDCLIVDDFSISGGTLADVARALRERGAGHIYAALSHCLLKESGVKRIDESPIEQLIVTDTVRCPVIERFPKAKVITVAPLFAESVRRIHNREPLGEMFEHMPERVLAQSFSRQMTLFDLQKAK